MPKPIYKTKTSEGVALIRVECPEEVFDVEGAYIMRRKRVPVYVLDAIKGFKPGQEEELYVLFAKFVPQWSGVVDVETGEPLPDLADEPHGLTKLDNEQLQWLVKMLQASPLAVAAKTPPPPRKFGSNGQM